MIVSPKLLSQNEKKKFKFLFGLQAFFKENPAAAAERTIEQSCENILLNLKWMEREANSVTAYLKACNN